MKIIIGLFLGLAFIPAVHAGPNAVEPGAVEAAEAISAHLTAVPQSGGALDSSALLSTIQQRLSVEAAPSESEVESGMALLKCMTDPETAAGIDGYLRTARTEEDPALGQRTADNIKEWAAAVQKARAQKAFGRASQQLAKKLQKAGLLVDADIAAAVFDGSQRSWGAVVSGAIGKKAMAARLSRVAQKVGNHPAWERIGKIGDHPAWGAVHAAARIGVASGTGGVFAALALPLLHIGAVTALGLLLSTGVGLGALLAFDLLMGLRAHSWDRKVSTWVPTMIGFVLGSLLVMAPAAFAGLALHSVGQVIMGGALTLAASLLWGKRPYSVRGVLKPVAFGTLAGIILTLMPAVVFGTVQWFAGTALNMLLSVAVAGFTGLIGGMIGIWLAIPAALAVLYWLYRRSARR